MADFGRDFETGNWSMTSRYLYGQAVDQLLARWDAHDGNASFHLADNLGSVNSSVLAPEGISLQAKVIR